MEFRPSIEDRIKIGETVNYYFEGMKKGKSEIIRKAFVPEASLWGNIDGKFRIIPLENFLKGVDATGELDNFKYTFDILSVDGNIASVKFIENNVSGVNYNNFFNLVKIDGTWKIVAKLFNPFK